MLNILKSWWLSALIGLVVGILITVFEVGIPAINLVALGALGGGIADAVKEVFLYFTELGGASWKNLGIGFLGGIIGALIIILL